MGLQNQTNEQHPRYGAKRFHNKIFHGLQHSLLQFLLQSPPLTPTVISAMLEAQTPARRRDLMQSTNSYGRGKKKIRKRKNEVGVSLVSVTNIGEAPYGICLQKAYK